MRIAVVGAGLAGLTAAWLLGRQHQVTLFERQAAPGFTAANVALDALDGAGPRAQRVDVPLRVFYPGYYPSLTRLYAALSVPTEPVSYAGSFYGPAFSAAAGASPSQGLFFRYRNLRWRGHAWAVLAPQDWLLGATARRIVREVLRFNRQAVAALRQGQLNGLSIGQYLQQEGYADEFVQGFVLPTISTVCTCSFSHALEFPAPVIVDYLARGVGSQSVHRVLQGADEVQRRLLAGIAELRCGARIAALRRPPSQRTGGWLLEMEDGPAQHVDHVVLATQANQARSLLADASPEEAAMLDGFHYESLQVLTHTDSTLMPPRRADWSPVNLWVSKAQDLAEATIWVNAVQPALRAAADVFQTVHPLRPVHEERVLGRAQFQRPMVDARSQRALQQLQQLHAQPGRDLWFCGSYAQPGIPLLESAVASAYVVAGRLAGPINSLSLPGRGLG